MGATQALAADDKSKATLVYDHVLPNVPGKSIRGVLVEYAPGDFASLAPTTQGTSTRSSGKVFMVSPLCVT
jgi:hypothetical protein